MITRAMAEEIQGDTEILGNIIVEWGGREGVLDILFGTRTHWARRKLGRLRDVQWVSTGTQDLEIGRKGD